MCEGTRGVRDTRVQVHKGYKASEGSISARGVRGARVQWSRDARVQGVRGVQDM